MAVIGISAKLEYESGSSWAEVDNCKQVMFPAFSVSSIDTTHLGLTDFGMTFMPGMVDAGACSFTAEYTEATYTALQGLTRDLLGWRVTAPDEGGGSPVIVTCDGFLTKLEVSITPNEEVMISGEIKFTGLPQVS